MTNDLDDVERRDVARAEARLEMEGADATRKRWNIVLLIAGLLFVGWAFYGYMNMPSTTAGNTPTETTGRSERAPTPPATSLDSTRQ